MSFIKKNGLGILICFIISIPAWFFGKYSPPILIITPRFMPNPSINKKERLCRSVFSFYNTSGIVFI